MANKLGRQKMQRRLGSYARRYISRDIRLCRSLPYSINHFEFLSLIIHSLLDAVFLDQIIASGII